MSTRRSPAVDFGQPMVVVRRGPLSLRRSRRSVVVAGTAVALAVIAALAALCIGDHPVAPDRVFATLAGGGTGREDLVVLEWRLPRMLVALMCGAALALSGAIVQSLTRNSLGSPDIIGFNAGAVSGALAAITVGGLGYLNAATGALLGGVVTAAVVYLFSHTREGFVGGRLILVGIGVTALLASANSWLMIRADQARAMAALRWTTGSLIGTDWADAAALAVTFAVLLPLVAVAARPLALLDFGEEIAHGSGVRSNRVGPALLLLSVALIAPVIAVVGPVAFLALAAPQIARRLAGSAAIPLLTTALVGAILLVTSDVIADQLVTPRKLPVGVVTLVLGGVYLAYLLVMGERRRT